MPPHSQASDQSQDCTLARTLRFGRWDAYSPLGLKMVFAKDEEIYGQDESANLLFRVVSGAVRTTHLMSDGRRQIGEFYYPGEVFGIEAGNLHRYSAEALGETVVLALKISALRTAAGNEAFERMVCEAAGVELNRAQEHLMLLGRKSAYERVATFLIDIADRRRSDAVTLPMSRQDMADYLGLTIETVSRMLTRLQATLAVEFDTARQFHIRNRFQLARLAH